MSTQRSLNALIDRATATLIAKTGQHNPAIDAIACAIAGVSYGQYGYQDQLFRELHPETASEPWLYLHAERHDVERLLPTFAKGFIQFEQLGGVVSIPKGSIVIDITGSEYQTIRAQYSNEDVEVIALIAGVSGNLPNGAVLRLSKSISGVDPDNVLCLGFSGGADIEELEHWRQRICTAFNKGQEVGRRDDYESWALSAHADVDFAWALDNTPERGMVQVYIGARENDPTLSLEVITTVQTFIDKERLAGCHPLVAIPTHKAVDVEIQNVQDEQVRADVIVALQELFKDKMGQRDESVNPPKQVSITPTEIVLAIAPITSNYIVKQPTEEQFISDSEIHVLGEVTWTPLT
ncbi:baseplate J/gp47 family protein [Aliivibrio fischeri]|uniref:baseplate J/gp47 family protein n=1 Tax=Aliivibrio fischeri TaxID=668 RepID=UPI003735E5BA